MACSLQLTVRTAWQLGAQQADCFTQGILLSYTIFLLGNCAEQLAGANQGLVTGLCTLCIHSMKNATE
jgi:hypothetical protein